MFRYIIDNRKEIKKILNKNIKSYTIAVFMMILSSFFSVVIPLCNMKLINLFVYQKINGIHMLYSGGYILLIVMSLIVDYYSINYIKKFELNIQQEIQIGIINNALNKKLSELGVNQIGDNDATIKHDSIVFCNYLMNVMLNLPFAFFRLAIIVIFLLFYSVEAIIIVVLAQLLIKAINRNLYKVIEKQSEMVRNSYSELNEVQSDIIANTSYVGMLGASRYLLGKFKSYYNNYCDQMIRHIKKSSLSNKLSELILELSYIVILCFGGVKIYSGNMQVGALLLVFQYSSSMISSFKYLLKCYVELHVDKKSIMNVIDVLNSNENESKIESKVNRISDIDKIIFSNVYFSYDDKKNIFTDLNIEFCKNKANCIYGPSGSGKSTLLKLILGEYEVDKGMINMCMKDGEVHKISIDNISFVPQDNIFFTDTIYNNLTLGENVNKDEVIEVCKECAIYNDIMELEKGFDTIISNGIVNFSGGQIKRLSLARAILQRKEVLLLDEPTANLDLNNTDLILECIKKYSSNKIVLLITHDYKAKNKIDNVFELKEGKLKRIK